MQSITIAAGAGDFAESMVVPILIIVGVLVVSVITRVIAKMTGESNDDQSELDDSIGSGLRGLIWLVVLVAVIAVVLAIVQA